MKHNIQEVANKFIQEQILMRKDPWDKKFYDIDKWVPKIGYSDEHNYLTIWMSNSDLRNPLSKHIVSLSCIVPLTQDFQIDRKKVRVEVVKG